MVDAAVALHGDAAAHLHGLARDPIARVKGAAIAVDGRSSRARDRLRARAAQVPVATVFVDGQAIGQGQVVVDAEVAIDVEVAAAKGHSVQYTCAVVVAGGQRRGVRAQHRAALDRAAQIVQPAGSKQAFAANVQRACRVVQRAAKIDDGARRPVREHRAQVACQAGGRVGGIQVQRAAVERHAAAVAQAAVGGDAAVPVTLADGLACSAQRDRARIAQALRGQVQGRAPTGRDMGAGAVGEGNCGIDRECACRDTQRAVVGEGVGVDRERLPGRIGDDAAVVDQVGQAALVDAAVALHGDAAAHLHGLARDPIARVKGAAIAVDGRSSRARDRLRARAAQVPVATVFVDGQAIGQGQVVVDAEVAIDVEVAAAKGHSVQYTCAVVVAGGQRRGVRAQHRAALDRAAQIVQPAGSKQAFAANVQRACRVVQRAAKIDDGARRPVREHRAQVACQAGGRVGGIQVQRAAVERHAAAVAQAAVGGDAAVPVTLADGLACSAQRDRARIAQGLRRQVQSRGCTGRDAGGDLGASTVGKYGRAHRQRASRDAQNPFVGEGVGVDSESLPCRIGDDAAVVDQVGRAALSEVAVALHGDATAHLQGLTCDPIARVKKATTAINGRRPRARDRLRARGVEGPVATVLTDGHAIGQGQVVVDAEVAIDIEVAAKGHPVKHACPVVVVGGQRRGVRTQHRAALDGAVQIVQPAGAKQAGTANVQRAARVVQRAGKIDERAGRAV